MVPSACWRLESGDGGAGQGDGAWVPLPRSAMQKPAIAVETGEGRKGNFVSRFRQLGWCGHCG